MKFSKFILLAAIPTTVLFSCTKLDEQFNGDLTQDQVGGGGGSANVDALLAGVYNSMRLPYQDQSRFWAAEEHTTDECLGPTRGGDWDDNGIWRLLHVHKWDGNHSFLASTYEDLGGVIYGATDLLQFKPTAQQDAEARFLRAFAMFSKLDGWNQVGLREVGGDPLALPKVLVGRDALDFIISELKAIQGALPNGPANKANKDAATVLLMKCYLNKGVISASADDPLKNRKDPQFDAADMTEVIRLAETLKGKYSLATNYFDNFAPDNDAKSTENIFTAENIGGSNSGNVRSRWFCTLHYNQNPSGWNGFTTLSDFYNKFDATDVRRSESYTGMTDKSGIKAGFLIGQQFDQNGVALKDRKGQALAFTPEVAAIERGNNLEVTGIRVIKYPIDYASGDNANNDYVYFRYADVLLMEAEAVLRGGSGATSSADALVNLVRKRAGLGNVSGVTLDQLLDERGREFYWEGQRRTDLIRFGKFLDPWQEKPEDNEKNLLFPIPYRQVAANPNIAQNPGY